MGLDLNIGDGVGALTGTLGGYSTDGSRLESGETPIQSGIGLPKVGDLVKGISGQAGAEAALRGAELQHQAALAGIAEQRAGRESIQQNLQPFLDVGTSTIPALLDFQDPSNQAAFVQNNPLFQQLAQDTTNRVFNNQAAQGLLGSTGTATQLGNQLLPLGMAFAQQRGDDLFRMAGMGQNAAALQGSNIQNSTNAITDLLGQSGNAMAAGGVGAANSFSQGGANVAGIASTIFGGLMASDRRLKRNITHVGTHGKYNKYEYQYKNSDKWYIGVMADEVKEINPSAVVEVNGYYHVNYGAL